MHSSLWQWAQPFIGCKEIPTHLDTGNMGMGDMTVYEGKHFLNQSEHILLRQTYFIIYHEHTEWNILYITNFINWLNIDVIKQWFCHPQTVQTSGGSIVLYLLSNLSECTTVTTVTGQTKGEQFLEHFVAGLDQKEKPRMRKSLNNKAELKKKSQRREGNRSVGSQKVIYVLLWY